jgi:SAM-dependent methyltransferase
MRFIEGNAEHLPSEFTARFDVAVNLESSHCYGDFAAFVREVKRVLRADGMFLYADFMAPERVSGERDDVFIAAGFRIVLKVDITEHVFRALQMDNQRKTEWIERMPSCFHSLLKRFSVVQGTGLFNLFATRGLIYVAYCLSSTP